MRACVWTRGLKNSYCTHFTAIHCSSSNEATHICTMIFKSSQRGYHWCHKDPLWAFLDMSCTGILYVPVPKHHSCSTLQAYNAWLSTKGNMVHPCLTRCHSRSGFTASLMLKCRHQTCLCCPVISQSIYNQQPTLSWGEWKESWAKPMGTALCALVKSWTDKSVEERDLSACSKPSEKLSTCASLLTLTNMHTSSIAVASPVQSKPALATACLRLLGCSVSCSLQPDGLTCIPAC